MGNQLYFGHKLKGRFELHSLSVQMVTHAFLANVETTRQLRQSRSDDAKKPVTL